MTFDPRRRLLQGSLGRHGDGEDEPYFVNYIPPARDAITLPRHVIYILVGVVLVVVATYAIVGHLIKDLMHDLADWILGPKPVEVDTERGKEVKVDRWNGRVDDRGEKARMETEEEGRVGLLPGYYRPPAPGSYRPPAPPSRSSMSAFPGEKRSSHQNVTFALPVTPYVTSV